MNVLISSKGYAESIV